MIRKLIVFLAAGCPLALAQTPNAVGGPMIGLVIDSAQQLRSISGVSGASTMGPAIALPPDVGNPALSPKQDYLLATRTSDGGVVLFTTPFDFASRTSIDGVSSPGQIAFSPAGSSAVFLAADSSRLQVVTGLPGSPTIAWQASLTAALTPAFLAVSDDGSAVLASSSGSVFLLSQDRSPAALFTGNQVSGLAFLAGRNDALIADSGLNQTMLIRDVAGSATTTLLADASAGVNSPVGVAASADDSRAFVANGNPGGVLVLDLSGKPAIALACACTPDGIVPLGNSIFQLTKPSQGPAWMFQSNDSSQQVFFVPPATDSETQQ